MSQSVSRRGLRPAITAVFALNGVLFASIFSRLPAIRERAQLSEGELGLALLCSMIGLLITQLAGGAAVARWGSRPVVIVGATGYAAALIPVALADSMPALCVAMALVGLSNGMLDISMNVHGLTVERRLKRPILSTLHAAFSFGALGGAAAGGAVAAAGVGVTAHLPGAAVVGAAWIALSSRFLLPRTADAAPHGPQFAVPNRALVGLGAFAFCALLAEGAANDWVAVYLEDTFAASDSLAAAGLAGFSLTMAGGRLAGDWLTRQLGARRIAFAGALLAAGGAGAAVAATGAAVAIAGFAAMGLGLATLFPLAVRVASEQQGAPGVAALSATGYAGFLAGPALVGGLAELGSLRLSLGAVALLCVLAAVLAKDL